MCEYSLMLAIHGDDIVHFCRISAQITMHRVVIVHVCARWPCDARSRSPLLIVVPFDHKIRRFPVHIECQILCLQLQEESGVSPAASHPTVWKE